MIKKGDPTIDVEFSGFGVSSNSLALGLDPLSQTTGYRNWIFLQYLHRNGYKDILRQMLELEFGKYNGDFYGDMNKTTPQIHIVSKFEDFVKWCIKNELDSSKDVEDPTND